MASKSVAKRPSKRSKPYGLDPAKPTSIGDMFLMVTFDLMATLFTKGEEYPGMYAVLVDPTGFVRVLSEVSPDFARAFTEPGFAGVCMQQTNRAALANGLMQAFLTVAKKQALRRFHDEAEDIQPAPAHRGWPGEEDGRLASEHPETIDDERRRYT